ncbi:MAG: helix-turn-helix transcriptional regulator, partial [Bacteroidota bacterium]
MSVVHIETLADICRLAGMPPPRHPLIGIVDLSEVGQLPTNFPLRMTYGFYCLGCKRNLDGAVRYGHTSYDFDHGVLGYTRPHQIIEFGPATATTAEGWLLYVHPDFLRGHPIQAKMESYSFFDYHTDEALHLSAEEEATIFGIITNLFTEYHQPIDRFSREVMLANLELLLSYSNRFYHRQFLTRHQPDDAVYRRFVTALGDHLAAEAPKGRGLPTVGALSDQLHLSPGYLSDLLRATTGKGAQEHIHLALIERGKNLLRSGANVSETATALGFQYPQYFSRLFKARTGVSPRAWAR